MSPYRKIAKFDDFLHIMWSHYPKIVKFDDYHNNIVKFDDFSLYANTCPSPKKSPSLTNFAGKSSSLMIFDTHTMFHYVKKVKTK